MTVLDAVLVARAHTLGRAQRASSYRHRRLVPGPIVLVPWHLGAEPFTFAALAFGTSPERFDIVVPGEPRDRRLLFPVALEVARWFNRLFELPWEDRTEVEGGFPPVVASSAPQVWVPNDGAVTVLGKLGRRLAYLPTEPRPEGPPPADPELVRFGRHLQFLAAHASTPGQQLVISAADLAGASWVTEQTVAERANLLALDAWIEPPEGSHGFDAAVAVEETSVGPLPPPAVETDVADLIDAFNVARRANDEETTRARLDDQRRLYTEQTGPAWDATWRAVERERSWPEEPRFVPRRWQEDVNAYSLHMGWLNGPAGGRRRTRQTVRQAIRTRQQIEQTKALVEAEEAISDPIRMISFLLDHKAVEGTMVGYDAQNREVKPGNQKASRVPILTLRTERPCLIPRGKELWWTMCPDRVRGTVASVTADPHGAGSLVEIKIQEHVADASALSLAPDPVCFSELTTREPWNGRIPDHVPWTHRAADDTAAPGSLEDAS